MEYLIVDIMNLINFIVTIVIAIIAYASCTGFMQYRAYMAIIDSICYFKEDIAANDMFQLIWLFIVMFAAVFNLLQIRKIIK